MDKPRLPLPAEPLPNDCPVATNLANVVQSLPQSLADERRHLVIVTEGIHDIAFLKSISTLLQSSDAQLPDLLRLEKAGRLTFIPTGGGSLCDWVYRLAGLGHREFHLYDREVPPVTEERLRLVAAINRRPGCVARLTGKRSLENYLDRQAILQASGADIEVDDSSDIPGLVAQQVGQLSAGAAWQDLSRRSRNRLRNRVKRRLNTLGVEGMTLERLALRDPLGEVAGWLRTVACLLSGNLS